MATFYVLNNKKYRTSVRLRDGRLEAIRFEPEVYFGGIGQSTYTTSDPEVIEALKKHYAYGTTFWERNRPQRPTLRHRTTYPSIWKRYCPTLTTRFGRKP